MISSKKIYIYARESSKGSLAKIQLNNQIFGIKNFTEKHKLKIEETFSEMVSASNFLNQKSLNSFFKNHPNSHLIVSSVDRFCRSYRQIQLVQNRLTDSNCSVTFIREKFELDLSNTFENIDKFHKHVKFADEERRVIAERCRKGKINKKRKRLEEMEIDEQEPQEVNKKRKISKNLYEKINRLNLN